jgi:Protein of unknown function (DUF3822)
LKQLFSISTNNISEIVQPVLAIRIGEHHCCFAIVNSVASELGQLAYYSSDEINADVLATVFSTHSELNNSFFQVLVCYDYPQNAIVPFKYFNADDTRLMLNATCSNVGNTAIISEVIPGWQIYNIYAVPKDIHDWISRKFPAGKYWHNYSVAMKNIAGADASGCISVNLFTNDLTLLAGKENTLLLAQSFPWSTPEDVIYYLLKVCQQLNLSQQKVKLVLSGLIEKQSVLYKELHQYFLHIEFREASWNSSHKYPAHFFTSLNDLARCAS